MDDPEDSDDDFLRAVAKTPEIAPRPPPPTDSLARLAQFRIDGKLGRGGMGIVYRAEDEKLRRTVALKVLPDDFADDEQKRKHFFREARVAGSINHPNVATVYEVGEADGRIYIAMELVPGVTLRKLIEERRLDEAEALHICREIARGVSRAHARGIAHRDLKPDNVMVDEGGKVKVLDFGLAKPVEIATDSEESVTWTQEGRIVGTPGYMSPEQATGRTVDVRTDVFSLGVILYEMLAGQRPFVGETSMEVVIATSRDRPRALSAVAPKVSRSLDAVVARCLEKEPSLRYANATEVLEALETRKERPRSRSWLVAGAFAVASIAAWRIAAPSPPTVAASLPLPTTSAASTRAPAEPPPESPAAPPSPPPPPSPPTPSPSTSTPPSSPVAAVARAVPRPSASNAVTPATTPPHQPAAIGSASRGGVIETSPY